MEFGEKLSVESEHSPLCRLVFALFIPLCSLQVQKKNYREEKKRATKELLSTITDPSVIVMADWLKVGRPRAIFPSATNPDARSIVMLFTM